VWDDALIGLRSGEKVLEISNIYIFLMVFDSVAGDDGSQNDE
jgi:hypothetical protein